MFKKFSRNLIHICFDFTVEIINGGWVPGVTFCKLTGLLLNSVVVTLNTTPLSPRIVKRLCERGGFLCLLHPPALVKSRVRGSSSSSGLAGTATVPWLAGLEALELPGCSQPAPSWASPHTSCIANHWASPGSVIFPKPRCVHVNLVSLQQER